MIRKNSSFWPTKEELLLKHPSLEFINPQYDSDLRKSSHITSIFTLVSNICGGGVLTLPIAFSKAGLVPSVGMMMLSAIMTDFAMYILCSCARRTGGTSYGQVTRSAFGVKAELAVTVLLLLFLCFVLVAYMVLVKDIWTPLILYISPTYREFCIWCLKVEDPEASPVPSFVFLAIFLVASLPLLLQRDLHALRYTCYVGFASLILLIVAIVRRSILLNIVTERGLFRAKVKWFTDDWGDIIYAFPIISLSFFSIYNVLSVHSALINPTRERVKQVLDRTISICFILFLIIGTAGYLYAYDETKDNILLNFPLSYKIVLIGRLGYGFTLMFGLPLIFLPCRAALLAIPKLYHDALTNLEVPVITPNITPTISRSSSFRFRKHGMALNEDKPLTVGSVMKMNDIIKSVNGNMVIAPMVSTRSSEHITDYGSVLSTSNHHQGHYFVNGIDFDAERPVLIPNTTKTNDTDSSQHHMSSSNSKDTNNHTINKTDHSTFAHLASTFVILICCYFTSVAVPGVGIVWSICGSSMGLIIGFFIPAACYLKIRSNKKWNPRSVGAWSLMIFSTFASIICTSHTLAEMKNSDA